MKIGRSAPRGESRRLARRRWLRSCLVLATTLVTVSLTAAQAPALENQAPVASGWTMVKFPQPQPACTGLGFLGAVYYDRLDCGFGYVPVSETTLTGSNASIVKVSFIDSSGVTRNTQTTTARTADNAWQFNIRPGTSWAPGTVTIRVTEVDPDGAGPEPNQVGNFGETTFILNQLGASLGVLPKSGGGDYQPGDAVSVSGRVFELDQVPPLAAPQETGVAATFSLRVVLPDGTGRGPFGPFTADSDGDFNATVPGSATAGLTADASTNYEIAVSIEVVDASFNDLLTGAWAADRAGATPLVMTVPPSTLVVENSFVSAVGWVKPGESYPFRVFVKNFTANPAAGAQVTLPAADGMVFTNATAAAGSGSASFTSTSVTWTIGNVPARTNAGPAVKTLIVQARADTLGQDAQIVWKNLSTRATLNYTGGPVGGLTATSHGPKVIPPKETFDTARYGDRPFPVVPVDYFDRKHETIHTGDRLSKVINSPGVAGSTFNLYQEMSYGQLFPNGTVPSSGIATKGWEYGPGFDFTTPQPAGACTGTSFKDFRGSAVYPERIHDGWYQIPGDTQYYGADKFSAGSLAGAIGGIGLLFAIDDACGPTGKAVYDAAQIADPEIDYSDYDTDKDGVVDFFMMVFVGAGGNGVSQTSVPPYDNIWPHSSSLEFYYSDPATGLKGYISDDQLEDLQGRPLYYTNSSRSATTVTPTDFPVYVRVGPYNVNPESAVEHASVISHEYGHSLGLPDFYSLGSRETYGDWTLMATDKSQNMDVFSKQELGWLVPRVLDQNATVTGWVDSKVNTHRIDWKTAAGTSYTLTGSSVNNGQGYVAKLPSRQIIDPAQIPSPDHVWWSRSGNDFGCTPQGAHNLDIALPELATLPAGTPVTVTFKSKWDIEWDFDYGFVMVSTDGGNTYRSLPSQRGYTTATFNPTANACQAQYGNGLTGTSGSYAAGTQDFDRLAGNYPAGGFLDDRYDLSSAVGQATVLRLSYATDPGLARPGWFLDDLRITAGSQVIYDTDFESSGDPNDPRVFNGGCKESTRTAATCTDGWSYVSASAGSPADHAYYLEMRDRSGFDLDGKGQNDRDPIAFSPGLLLVYTDEAHGYGNVGVDDPPAQTPLDAQPQPGNRTPNLDDAAFTDSTGDTTFSDSGVGHTDNYTDPANDEVDSRYPSVAHPWRFRSGCLGFEVLSMTGERLNPPTLAYDLQGNVHFTIGAGCAPFDYGYEGGNFNVAPTALAQARPNPAAVGEEVTFDGSASTDDGPQGQLRYQWDFDGNGTVDATGQVARHTYTTAGTYTARLRVTDGNGTGLSDEDTLTITVRELPNLRVTNMVASNNRSREGDKVTFTATVNNNGGSPAAQTQTEFKLDDSTVVGLVTTEAIAAGASRPVSVEIFTNNMRGQHTMRATADAGNAVAESNELDNFGVLTFTVKGNKVQNGSFEQASGSEPASWSGSSTQAGSASYDQSGGTNGSKSASMSGNGGNAALYGSPTWTSDAIGVVVGETLDFQVSVSTFGASTAPTAGLVYLGPLGNVIDTVNLIAAPLTTQGFETLEHAVTIPPGVADVRVVLRGFAPTDVATAGTVTFDDVGLFAQ